MSMFNQDWCCEICIGSRKRHPDYNKAREIEREEVIKGNTNYEGVGLPDEYDTWAKEQRLRLLHEDEDSFYYKTRINRRGLDPLSMARRKSRQFKKKKEAQG